MPSKATKVSVAISITAQHCDSDLEKFFRLENQPFPPSMSDDGSSKVRKKSDLVQDIVGQLEETHVPPYFDWKTFDGVAVVDMLNCNHEDLLSTYFKFSCPK